MWPEVKEGYPAYFSEEFEVLCLGAHRCVCVREDSLAFSSSHSLVCLRVTVTAHIVLLGPSWLLSLSPFVDISMVNVFLLFTGRHDL